MHRLRFTVPAPDKLANPVTDTSPTSVTRWITELPYADLTGVTREVLRSLSLLNRHPGRVSGRAELMAAYRIPSARLVRAGPGGSQAPSSAELRQLMTEMAYGYKHILNDILGQSSWLQNRKRLTHALYFAAKFLSLELFLAFETYQCKVTNSWRELLALYRLAEQQNLHHTAVEDRDQPESANATVSHVLKRILLLRLQDPCHLVPGEARSCFDYFNRLASNAVLENPDWSGPVVGRFLLDLDGMEPPRPPDPDTRPSNPERFRYFNLAPVSREIHQQLRDMELHRAEPPEGLKSMRELDPGQVLKRILLAWHNRQERRNTREESFGWMLCGFGMGAVSHFLLNRDEDVDEDSSLVEMSGRHVGSLSSQQVRYDRIRARQVNRSEGGICIRLQVSAGADPKVGKVLLLQEERMDQPGNLYAGIIRRRQLVDSETLEIGIQFIRGEIKPINLHLPGDDAEPQPGLWVERPGLRHSSLFCNRGQYRKGREFLVECEESRWVAVADQLVEVTPSFERFRYKVKPA